MAVRLTPELLLNAYAAGVFPMAESREDPDLFWVDPQLRGIIPLDGFRMSRSLRRRILRAPYRVTLDADFAGVVAGCADREETWINGTIADLYQGLHARGFSHSLELWKDDALVGGLYGVAIGGAFFGESMFSRRRDASKVALAYLVAQLQRAGFALLDTQFVTPHLASLGGIEISRGEYRLRLVEALELHADLTAAPLPAPQEVVQRITQTS